MEYPALIIAGTASPKIECSGPDLEFSSEQDALIVEQINNSKADILFINLGNPKQELWFDRVKNDLHVPVSIGIGETLDLFTEMIPRAPLWMRKSGMEGLFRLIQQPQCLWKRDLNNIFQFPLMVVPALVYHTWNKLRASLLLSLLPQKNSLPTQLYLSSEHSLAFILLPPLFEQQQAADLLPLMEDYFNQDALIFDFKEVHHLSLEGLAFLVQVSQRAQKLGKPLFFLNLSLSVKILWKLQRFDDVLLDHLCQSAKEILDRLHQIGWKRSFYDSIHQNNENIWIGIFGYVDAAFNQQEYLQKIMPMVQNKVCIVDLSYCVQMHQAELCLLLKIKKNQEKQLGPFKITGASKSIKRKIIDSKTDLEF